MSQVNNAENVTLDQLGAATRMEEIVIEISQSLANIQTESVKVGQLLTEANSEFKEQGKKSQDFLDWAFANFSIKKAQAYKLMTVAEHFGTDDRFKGVSMRVLYALATQADEDQLNRAAELVANGGELTTTTLNILLNPQPVAPKAPPIDDNKQAGQDSLNNVPSAPPSNTGEGEGSAPSGGSQAPTVPVPTEGDAALAEDNKALRAQVTELLAQVKELTEAQHRFNKGAAAPVLPQFKHKDPCVVLGLSADDAASESKIKAAFRGLVKAGYGNEHEAFDLLVAARDKLLAAE